MSLSSKAFPKYQKDDRIPVIKDEAVNISTNFTFFSSFLVMFALSSVIGIEVESYYQMSQNEPVYKKLFTCSIIPHVVYPSCCEKIHVFKCCSASNDYIRTRKPSPVPDHFLPLIQNDADESSFDIPEALRKNSLRATKTRVVTGINLQDGDNFIEKIRNLLLF